MPNLNYENPRLSHEEVLKEERVGNFLFKLKRQEWYTQAMAWTDNVVEMYKRKPRRRRGYWPDSLVSKFTLMNFDKANQLYILMVEGLKQKK